MPAKKAAPAVPLRGQKLSLGFGLVNVPVAMKPLAETQRPVPGKGLCPEHGPQLSQMAHCCVGTDAEHVLGADEKVIGYPHPDDPTRYVVVDPAVIKQLEESRSGQAAIEGMVDVSTIDAGYFDKAYLVWPQPGGEQAFDLLVAALRQSGKAAVVTAVLRKQTQTLVFRWSDDFECLLSHVVKFETELRHDDAELVRQAAEVRPEPDEQMVAVAAQLLASLEVEFDASEVQDTLTPLLNDAIRAADNGTTYEVVKPDVEQAPAGDLMAALQASLGGPKKPAAKKPAAKKRVTA